LGEARWHLRDKGKHTVSATQTLSLLSFNSAATSPTIALTFSGGNAILLVLTNLFDGRVRKLLRVDIMFVWEKITRID